MSLGSSDSLSNTISLGFIIISNSLDCLRRCLFSHCKNAQESRNELLKIEKNGECDLFLWQIQV